MRRKRDTMLVLDSILFNTKFSGRTKSLYSYFTQGDKILEKEYIFYGYRGVSSNQTFLERAQGDKAIALYALNMKLNGAWFEPSVKSTRAATKARWEVAIRLIDKARAQLRI